MAYGKSFYQCLSLYRPMPVDDWDDYVRLIKLVLNYEK